MALSSISGQAIFDMKPAREKQREATREGKAASPISLARRKRKHAARRCDKT
jgi:hypothetical protein